MGGFHEHLLDRASSIWNAMLGHRFLAKIADGTIPPETFKAWMKQDYLFVREATPFLSILMAKAPIAQRKPLTDALGALHQELNLFEQMAAECGVSFEASEMTPTCHAYVQFLMATAYGRPFEEGFTVLYGVEKAYLDSWKWVRDHLKGKSPWQAFIDHWTSDAFQRYVEWLANTLDGLVIGKSDKELMAIEDLFVITARYEYLFWEMAASKETWPI